MKGKSAIVILVCLIIPWYAQGKNKEWNELQKIFHHKADMQLNEPALELGKIVFYFAQDPLVNTLPSLSDREQKITLFFPHTKLSKDAIAHAAILKQFQGLYSVDLEPVNAPIKGIKCVIVYDPAAINFEYNTFDSIRLNKGIVLRFFNKQLLNEIAKQDRSVLKIVSARKKPGIVIDCGHGGHDDGAIGFFNLKEKDITMDLGLKVAHMLKKHGFDVFFTRKGDYELALDERTSWVNYCPQANLLVSIHANSSPNVKASGVETFCMNGSLFKKQELPNTWSTLAHSHLNQLYDQSAKLAQAVHQGVINCTKKKQAIVDRKVKHSVSQMLIGSNVPAALIEVGFLSNKDEAKLLGDPMYQHLIAQGICNGIISYIALA